MRRYFLVYQAGIANVFKAYETPDGSYDCFLRIMQDAFQPCENFCRGLIEAKYPVEVWSCNRAGDIANVEWTKGLNDCPFRDQARPPRDALFVEAAA